MSKNGLLILVLDRERLSGNGERLDRERLGGDGERLDCERLGGDGERLDCECLGGGGDGERISGEYDCWDLDLGGGGEYDCWGLDLGGECLDFPNYLTDK